MNLSQIASQLKKEIPNYINYFSDIIPIATLTSIGNIATVVTTTPHLFTLAGELINVSGAIIPIPIQSITQSMGLATVTTQVPHDLTQGYNINAVILGANQAGYNGNITVLTVPNRLTFTYMVNPSTVSPATGTMFLQQQSTINPYNGNFNIATIVNATTFTYIMPTGTNIYSPAMGTIIFKKEARITGAIAWEKFEESYSAQQVNKMWMCAVLGAIRASKDRHSNDDGIKTSVRGEDFRQIIIYPFSVYVITPLRDDQSLAYASGMQVRDQMEEVFVALIKSVGRFNFASPFTYEGNYQTVFASQDFYSYNGAYYVHEFNFETELMISTKDTVPFAPTSAFRQINATFNNSAGIAIASMQENLDDDPISS